MTSPLPDNKPSSDFVDPQPIKYLCWGIFFPTGS
jgi:hypothetical protein